MTQLGTQLIWILVPLVVPPQSQPPATPLSRAQKNNQLPEHTPSSLKVVTFNNVPPQPVTPSKSSDSKKPLEQPQNTQDKKRKQEHLTDNFKNSNLILIGYCPQQEEQAQLLDLIVYDILAKWDSYTLLGNLSFWEEDCINQH
ncbi:hypothetical protein RclHR1_02050024 [Rhizophagus clarus]|uniref:Uncharacterized protein n=1 Tax=Rhizophagus clarus TaxID=94130 RepID=A0A2Z6R6Z5_9GLOM|nr:hypothetical protein RclHR1_02050024 [Rhizophagus clarus]